MSTMLPPITALLSIAALVLPLWGVMLVWTTRLWAIRKFADLFDFGFTTPLWLSTIVMIIVAGILGALYGLWLAGRSPSRRRLFRDLFLIAAVGWLIFFIVLFATNLTPMCIGQDNGDGNNNLSDCLFLSVFWYAFFSALMIIPVTISVILEATVLQRLTLRNETKVKMFG
ncbi:MAG: hypothetical protein IT324_18310 [Anaerolineae bacterium]|nr:hypothetical protein [Anaerolineae bacterium]